MADITRRRSPRLAKKTVSMTGGAEAEAEAEAEGGAGMSSKAKARASVIATASAGVPEVPAGSFGFMHVLGFAFLALALPPAAFIIGSCTLWYHIDPITLRLCQALSRAVSPLFKSVVRHGETDGFLVPLLFLQGVVVPGSFAYCLYHHTTNGFTPLLAFCYHCVRLGPFFTNYAYCYTLCHKEGHQRRSGLFAEPYHHVFKHAWNWYIGLFYGVLPSSFAYGHSLNHHTYNNDHDDTITNWDKPRDSFMNYVSYIPRWFIYHLNISTIITFYKEGKYGVAQKMVLGTMYYTTFVGAVACVDPLFAAVYLLYPIVESILLLSTINWAWHCFLDPDTTNVFAYSITIFGGDEKTNILQEDYHVVHHMYPGAHWSTHEDLYERHKQEYVDNRASCFQGTHAVEVFFLSILRQYDVLADKFVDLSGEMSREEIVALIKTRLRTCSWGPNENTRIK